MRRRLNMMERAGLIQFGVSCCVAPAMAQEASSPAYYLALVDLKGDDDPISNPPEEACRDFSDRRVKCVDWRRQFLANGRIVQFFGSAAFWLPSEFRPDLFMHPASLNGRYLALYREMEQSGEGELIWLASKQQGSWCMPAEIVQKHGDQIALPPANLKPSGRWCMTAGKAERERKAGMATARRDSQWSWLMGRLMTQEYLGICDETEWCWNSLHSGKVTEAKTLAGKEAPSNFTLRYWAHASYVGKPRFSVVAAQRGSAEFSSPKRIELLSREEPLCLSASYFYPAAGGMPPPADAWRGKDGDWCFDGN